MDNETKQIIQSQYAKLPDDVRSAIESSDLRPRIQKVAENNNLRVDEAGLLEDEITLVLFGLESPDNFVENLTKALNMPTETINKIAKDVNNEIFLPVRSSLMKIHEGAETQPISEEDIPLVRNHVLKEIEEPTPFTPKMQTSTPSPEQPNTAPTPQTPEPAPAQPTQTPTPESAPPKPIPTMIPPDMPGESPEKPTTPEPASPAPAPSPSPTPAPSEPAKESPYSPETPKKPEETTTTPTPETPATPATPEPEAPTPAVAPTPKESSPAPTPPTVSAGFAGEKLGGKTSVSGSPAQPQPTQGGGDPYLEPIE